MSRSVRSFRMSDPEWDEITARAASLEISVGAYIRGALGPYPCNHGGGDHLWPCHLDTGHEGIHGHRLITPELRGMEE